MACLECVLACYVAVELVLKNFLAISTADPIVIAHSYLELFDGRVERMVPGRQGDGAGPEIPLSAAGATGAGAQRPGRRRRAAASAGSMALRCRADAICSVPPNTNRALVGSRWRCLASRTTTAARATAFITGSFTRTGLRRGGLRKTRSRSRRKRRSSMTSRRCPKTRNPPVVWRVKVKRYFLLLELGTVRIAIAQNSSASSILLATMTAAIRRNASGL